MGTFAVVRHDGEPGFTVDACHLNLWSLSGLLGRRVFFWDVGLTLAASEEGEKKGVSKIDLLLPFETEPDAFKDLSNEILDQKVAHLLFGRSVTVKEDTNVVSFTGDAARPDLKIKSVTATPDETFQKDKGLRRAHLSLWTIEFKNEVGKNPKTYIRVRFRMRTQGRTWLWMRSKRVALIDVRVADIRQIVVPTEAGGKLKEFGEKFVPLSRLNVFVIVPGYLLFKATSPALQYMRLFEGEVWERYLGGRKAALFGPEKLMIYQWQFPDSTSTSTSTVAAVDPPKVKTVSTSDPFRAFLIVGREEGFRTFLSAVLAAVLALIGVFLIRHPEYIRDGFRAVTQLAARYGYPLTIGTAVVALTWLFKNFGPIRTALNKIRKALIKSEDWLYRR